MLKERGVAQGLGEDDVTDMQLRIVELEQTIETLNVKIEHKDELITDQSELPFCQKLNTVIYNPQGLYQW